MKNSFAKFVSLLLALTMVLSLAACGNSNSSSTVESSSTTTTTDDTNTDDTSSGDDKDTTVAVGTTNSFLYMNPNGGGEADLFASQMIYTPLFAVDNDTGEYYSPLSDDWGWDDETTLRITVKDGITFTNGNTMDANDILATMEANYTWGNQNSGKWADYIDMDSTYVSDDGITIYIKFTQVYGPAISELFIYIFDDEYIAANDDSSDVWWNGPVGSGPYTVKEVVNGSYITYELRDDYWDTDASYDCTEITVKYYSDANAMWVDYQNGEIDVVCGLDDTQVSALEAGTVEGTLVLQSTNNVPMIVMNENNEYLSDINVRKAIAYAVDWAAVADIAWGSLATTATSHYASTLTCYNEIDISQYYTYDPEYARELLTEAGYAEGEISLYYVAVNETAQIRVMEAVQGYLDVVGITVECDTLELASALELYFGGSNDVAVITANSANNTREACQVLSATYNGLFIDRAITDSEYLALVADITGTTDQDARDTALAELDTWLFENYWMMPYCEVNEAWCFNSRIAELEMTNIGYDCLGNIKLA